MEQEHERQSNVLQIMMQERRDAKAHRDLTDAKFLECPTVEDVQETFSKFTKKEDFDHFKREISAKVNDSALSHQVQVVGKVCESLATKDSVTSLGQTVSRLSGKLEYSTIGTQLTALDERVTSTEEKIFAVQEQLKDPAVGNRLASAERQVSQLEANVKNSATKKQFADIEKNLNLFVNKSVAVKDFKALTNAFGGPKSQFESLVSVESVSVLEFGELQTSLCELQTTITGLVTGEALEDVKENLLKRQRNLVRLFEMLTKTQDEASRTQAEKDQEDIQKFKDLETRMNALELARKEDLEKSNSKISTINKSVASLEKTIAAQAQLIEDTTAEVSVSTKAISSFESVSASINVSADLQTQQKNGIEEIKKTLTNVESRLSLLDSVPLEMQILTGKQSSISKDVEGVRVRVGLVESAMTPLKVLPADLQSYSLTVQNTTLKLENVLSVVEGLKDGAELVKDLPKAQETLSSNHVETKTTLQGLEKDVEALRLAAATSFTNMQAAGKDLTHCFEKQTEHTKALEGVRSNMRRWVKELDDVCSQTEEDFKFAQKQTDRKASIEDLKRTKARMDSLEATFQSVSSFAPGAKTHIRLHKTIPKEVVELTARLNELDSKFEGLSMVAEDLTVVETTVRSHGEILKALAEPSDDTFGDNTEAQDNQSFSGESINDDVNFDGGNFAPFQDSMSDADPDYPVQHGYEDEPDQHELLEDEDNNPTSDDDSEETAPSDGSRQHSNVRKRPSSTPPAEEPPARRPRHGLKVWVDEDGDLATNVGGDETWDTMLEIWESQVKYFEGKSVDWLSVNTKDRCLRSMLMKRSHNWTTEKPGDFACKGCSNENNICVVQSLGSLVVLPLPSQAVADASGILGRFVAKEKLISRKLLEKDVWMTKT